MGFHERAGFACAKGSQPGTGAVSLLMVNMRKVLRRSGATVRMQAGALGQRAMGPTMDRWCLLQQPRCAWPEWLVRTAV